MNTFTKIILLSIGVFVGAIVVAGANQRKVSQKRRANFAGEQDIVDESSSESFPASDAPSWTTSSDKIH